MSDKELFEKLDQLAQGRLNEDERAELDAILNVDPALREKATEHQRLLDALKFFNKRTALKRVLSGIHNESSRDVSPSVMPAVVMEKRPSAWNRYWPLAAVAASVALISTFTTLYIAQSLETKQTAYYKELGRKVEQIKKSQNIIMADIAESKGKATPVPANYMGTGFLISPNGYLATSHHVIKNADSIYVENARFGSMKVDVLFSDVDKDVSILRIPSDKFKVLTSLPYLISDKEANLGEDVFTLGFPREDIVFGEGSISAATGYKQDSSAYQISVPVNPGNSGGPLFNSKGDVVGIISGLQTETSGTAFATKSSVLLKTITEIPDSVLGALTLPRQNALKDLAKTQKLSKWRDYVFMVRVYSDPAKN
ncbi:MAG TPA: trypsin-like peptidase domain-containing protein [Cyclobacteriaceae bacterium]|nr:trypsin-like peptidase domain-containing protein [Cyclobacteriaceae bacterium]